jgi:hypothetical protein
MSKAKRTARETKDHIAMLEYSAEKAERELTAMHEAKDKAERDAQKDADYLATRAHEHVKRVKAAPASPRKLVVAGTWGWGLRIPATLHRCFRWESCTNASAACAPHLVRFGELRQANTVISLVASQRCSLLSWHPHRETLIVAGTRTGVQLIPATLRRCFRWR